MESQKCCQAEGPWISFILRLTVASLFAVAAVAKFEAGLEVTAEHFISVFESTWLPKSVVSVHAHVIPFLEVLIPLWLLIGFRLRIAWVFTALVALTLAFGMAVVRGYGVAADNYFYVFLCLLGIYFSPADRFSVDGFKKAA